MKKSKILTTMIITMVFIVSTSTVAFAGGGDNSEYEIPVTVVEPVEPPKPLTPEGNLTLVDDIEVTDEIDKQFITAVSKNGNYFYLVIDRSGDEDNVYLLNMVDEADLLALMEGEEVAEPVPVPELTPEPEVEPIPEEPKKNSTLPLLIFVIAMCGGGAFYYLKFVKNKSSKGNSDLNEYDDDDYEDEDEDVKYQLEDTLDEDANNHYDNEDTELV